MKLVRHCLENIEGIGIFPTIGFVIFFIVFIAVLVFMATADKTYMTEMSQMPFDDEQQDNTHFSKK